MWDNKDITPGRNSSAKESGRQSVMALIPIRAVYNPTPIPWASRVEEYLVANDHFGVWFQPVDATPAYHYNFLSVCFGEWESFITPAQNLGFKIINDGKKAVFRGVLSEAKG